MSTPLKMCGFFLGWKKNLIKIATAFSEVLNNPERLDGEKRKVDFSFLHSHTHTRQAYQQSITDRFRFNFRKCHPKINEI